jgi:hypothetical protein
MAMPVRKGLERFDATTESGTWERVTPEASEPRVSGWVKRGAVARDVDDDAMGEVDQGARELQIELRDELLETMACIVARRKAARNETADDAGVIIAWTSSR